MKKKFLWEMAITALFIGQTSFSCAASIANMPFYFGATFGDIGLAVDQIPEFFGSDQTLTVGVADSSSSATATSSTAGYVEAKVSGASISAESLINALSGTINLSTDSSNLFSSADLVYSSNTYLSLHQTELTTLDYVEINWQEANLGPEFILMPSENTSFNLNFKDEIFIINDQGDIEKTRKINATASFIDNSFVTTIADIGDNIISSFSTISYYKFNFRS